MRLRDLAARVRRGVGRPQSDLLRAHARRLDALETQGRRNAVAIGALSAKQIAGTASTPNEAEFSAFSQYGEDGIIEFLIRRCDISTETFIEIGVEAYIEANTRFLAEHRLWSGLIVDQNPRLVSDLERTQLNWRAGVSAVSAFLTRDNVRRLVDRFIAGGSIGLLSIDVDGVDYWLLEQLVDLGPELVIVEYNALFGDRAAVAIPYDDTFDRRRADYHNIYYGASLGAYAHLLAGYSLVACTTAGNNAFFVRSDCVADVPPQSVPEAFRPRRFTEHRDARGALTGIRDTAQQLMDVAHLPLVDVSNGRIVPVRDLLA